MQSSNETTSSSRRGFLAGGALLGAGLLSKLLGDSDSQAAEPGSGGGVLNSARPNVPYTKHHVGNALLTACLQCNTGCGIKCKLEDGVVTKIDGNPYSPWTLLPHLPYATNVSDAAPVDGSICPKGQAGLQTAYDPYRIRKVLKRAGKRGENKWVSVPFEKAIEEICEGGALFSQVSGEETRNVEGLRQVMALRDAALAKAMTADVKAIWDEKDKAKKKELVEKFKQTHSASLDKLIDPEHPDLGPRNNQILVSWGRVKGGRGDLYKRWGEALGSMNLHGHTTVCQGSLYFTCKAISEQYEGGKFTNGQKFYWQADTENSRFILFVGANLFEANYGPPNRAVRLTSNLVSGFTKVACADPRFSKLASKSWKWLPLKPGSDAALAMAMIQWVLENKKFDAKFLRGANKAAAVANGENSWCNATWLVVVKDGKPGKFLRAADAKLIEPETRKTKEGVEFSEKFMTSMVEGKPVPVDPNDEKNAVQGDLFVDTKLPDGTHVKSGLQILLESSKEKTFAEWCAIADLREEDVLAVVSELASHGKQAAVDIHRGPAQHTNGFYNVLSWMTLNMLLGNFDAKGGMIKASAYDTMGKGKLFDMKAHPGKVSSFGVTLIRHGLDYEKTTLFSGYPAKRNWYPLSSDIYEELVPSLGDAYPYPVKIMFMYMGAPTYSLPAGHTNIEILCDTQKLPLFIASDILIGSTSLYADYIFPDLSFLERWEFQGSHPNIANKVQPIRQPVMAPIPEDCTVYGQKMPISFEALLLAVAERLKLPGFGEDGLGKGLSLKHPDDYYIRCSANVAFGEKDDASQNLPDANAQEMEIFKTARRHLPETIFSEERWKKLVGEKMWPKLVYLLNRGGRFEDHAKGYKGDRAGHPYAALLNMYQEKTASTIHAGTGKHHSGIARYLPIMDYHGQPLDKLRDGYELSMVTHRTVTQTKSRTIADPWLLPIMPENGILVNPADASRLKLAKGQPVKVVSATNTSGEWNLGQGNKRAMIGKVVITETVRPGVISFALGFGHWATGAGDCVIDGHVIKGEKARSAGVHANAAMWTDPAVPNTCLFDSVGGSVSFYDTQVRLEPVPG
jgi:anaerobic selenocysteine-containing dehydrogenase